MSPSSTWCTIEGPNSFTHQQGQGPESTGLSLQCLCALCPKPNCYAPDTSFCIQSLFSAFLIQLISCIVYLLLNSVFPQILYPLDTPETKNEADDKAADIAFSQPRSDSGSDSWDFCCWGGELDNYWSKPTPKAQHWSLDHRHKSKRIGFANPKGGYIICKEFVISLKSFEQLSNSVRG